LVANGNSDTAQSLAPAIKALRDRGIVVVVEDHADSQGGANTGWYSSMASAYGGDPGVWLGLPNEPPADGLAAKQVDLINAIRATGFPNVIALEAAGGWDMSQMGQVLQKTGTSQIIADVHIYDSGTDAAGYVANEANTGQGLGIPTWVGEFGDSTDGVISDGPNGDSTVDAVIAAQKFGKIAGATAWEAENGYHDPSTRTDNICTAPGCATIGGMGTLLTEWLSTGGAPSPVLASQPTPCVVASTQSAPAPAAPASVAPNAPGQAQPAQPTDTTTQPAQATSAPPPSTTVASQPPAQPIDTGAASQTAQAQPQPSAPSVQRLEQEVGVLMTMLREVLSFFSFFSHPATASGG